MDIDNLQVGSTVAWSNVTSKSFWGQAYDIVAFIERDDNNKITKIAFATCQKIFTTRNRNLRVQNHKAASPFKSDDAMLGYWYLCMSDKKAIKVKEGFNFSDTGA